MKIFAINPGSTSTKIALIDGDSTLFSKNVAHDANKLAEFDGISAQLPYRKETILNLLAEDHVTLDDVDAFVGRGGGLLSMEGGVYEVDELLLDHATRGANGVQHPAQLGPQLANEFARQYQKPAFVVNPPDVDEMQEIARMTGLEGVYRTMHLHSLNLKETAIRHAQGMGKKYEECNFIVCHIGGGISVSAHRQGKMVDGNDIVGGEGPMAPTRCGDIPASALIKYCAGKDPKEAKAICTRTGGLVSWLGTSDALEGGGMVHNKQLVEAIKEACGFIAEVSAYPGEFEMEAMASGAARVLTGVEQAKKYSGKPAWEGFDF